MRDYRASIKGLVKAYEKKGLEGVQMYCVVSFIPVAVAYTYLLRTHKDEKMKECLEGVIKFYKCEVID